MQPLIDSKKCRKCGETKLLSAFYPNKQCKLGVTGTCRECSQVRLRGWYKDTRKERQKSANSRNQERKKEIVEHFGDKCEDCKETYPPYVYQFHHLNPKEKDVNPSYAISSNPTEMWKELDKCIMLCANCHMIRHHGGE